MADVELRKAKALEDAAKSLSKMVEITRQMAALNLELVKLNATLIPFLEKLKEAKDAQSQSDKPTEVQPRPLD